MEVGLYSTSAAWRSLLTNNNMRTWLIFDLDDIKGVFTLLGGVFIPDRDALPLLSRKFPTLTKLALKGRCLLDAILFLVLLLFWFPLKWINMLLHSV